MKPDQLDRIVKVKRWAIYRRQIDVEKERVWGLAKHPRAHWVTLHFGHKSFIFDWRDR